MLGVLVEDKMAKAKPKMPPPSEDRVTLLNLKGSPEDRDFVKRLTDETGVPAATIARRGIAMWAKSRGLEPPAAWVGK